MSLVVAQATEHGPRITSDIQVGRWDRGRAALKDGTLKVIILSQNVAVCFAGHVELGLGAVRKFAAGLTAGQAVDDLIPMLDHVSAMGTVDFIVAQRNRAEQLMRITGNGVERRLPNAWIGDQDGFEEFQRARAGVLPEHKLAETSARVMHALRSAMKAVIDGKAISSVGGFEIAAANTQAGFEYFGSIYVHPGRDFVVPSATDDLVPHMIQTAEEGGYTACLVEPASAGVPAAALYFPTGGVVMMFLPLEFDTAQVIAGVRPTEFTKVIQDRFGIAMKQPGGPFQKQILAKG